MTVISRIRRLSPLVVSQIAAGEVVERPASVVKELLENAIDSGATQIDIYIDQAGTGCIGVCDNGHGIHEDDLGLALSRHTTSKLANDDVLGGVATLGFRGEALASIAAVSRLTLASSMTDSGIGYQVELVGEASDSDAMRIAKKPIRLAQGTHVYVRDLFFNIPARRRFLKSMAVEFGHIEQVVTRLAMVYFDIGFTLRHNEKQRLAVKPAHQDQEKLQRINQLAAFDFASRARKVATQHERISFSGWVMPSAPQEAKRKSIQQFYVNGRMVNNKGLKQLMKQLAQTYHCELDYVMFLEVAPDAVDVNIHPTKLDIRFNEEHQIHAIIRHVVSKQLKHNEFDAASHSSESLGKVLYVQNNRVLTQQHDGFSLVELTDEQHPHNNFTSVAKAQSYIDAIDERHIRQVKQLSYADIVSLLHKDNHSS